MTTIEALKKNLLEAEAAVVRADSDVEKMQPGAAEKLSQARADVRRIGWSLKLAEGRAARAAEQKQKLKQRDPRASWPTPKAAREGNDRHGSMWTCNSRRSKNGSKRPRSSCSPHSELLQYRGHCELAVNLCGSFTAWGVRSPRAVNSRAVTLARGLVRVCLPGRV